MKKIIPNIIVAMMLISGIGLLAYPTISDCINELHSSRAIGSYVKKTKDLSKEKKAQLLSEARAYNATLVNKKNRYFLKPEEKEQYNKLLDVTDTGIMGYVDIPK
ncbi:MAG: class C sortase, partial [Mogibacterium diversum]|nr:class C sortase [Mogibacterium diversum]